MTFFIILIVIGIIGICISGFTGGYGYRRRPGYRPFRIRRHRPVSPRGPMGPGGHVGRPRGHGGPRGGPGGHGPGRR